MIHKAFIDLDDEIGRMAGFLTRLIFRKLPIQVRPYAHEILKQQCLKSVSSSNNPILAMINSFSTCETNYRTVVSGTANELHHEIS